MILENKWQWKGLDGHFCLRHKCFFRLCTIVGNYMISSVGALYENNEMQEIGYKRHYEIMVFKRDEENKEIFKMLEVDMKGFKFNKKDDPYELDKQVEKEHIEMCYKYAKMQ